MLLGTSRHCSLHRSSALFLGKGARQSHTCSINPAQHVLAQSCSVIWKSSYSPCLSWSPLSAQRTVTGIPFGPNFPHTPSESSAEPGCLSFSYLLQAQSDPGKRLVSSCVQVTHLPLNILFSKELRKKTTEPCPCLAKNHTA